MITALTLSVLCGLFGGVVTTLFLSALEWANLTRDGYPGLLYFLPIAGLLIGGLYERFGTGISGGTNLIIEEIHRPSGRTRARSTPLIFFTSTLSHLFGASVGREGAVVQMSASLSDQISRFIPINRENRQLLLMAGSAAGFAAALGAPIAGIVFGMEVLSPRLRFRVFNFFECTIAAFTAYGVTRVLHAPHTFYGSLPTLPYFSFHLLGAAAFLGIATGTVIRIFILGTELLSKLSAALFNSLAARAFIGGLLVIGLVTVFGNSNSTGLGLAQIRSSFETSADPALAFQKLILTAVSISSGFKGGEFIPILFMGATFSSTLAGMLVVPNAFAAACGLVSSFGAAARVPLTLSIFAAEYFGLGFLVYGSTACLSAFAVMGKSATIYRSQLAAQPPVNLVTRD